MRKRIGIVLEVMNVILFAQNPSPPFYKNIINTLCVCDR